MRLGIYGGSFNPVHRLHVRCANLLVYLNLVDRVYLVPTHNNRLEPNKEVISSHHRMAMLALAIEDCPPNILISDFDVRHENNQSCKTISYFSNKYPEDELYFVLGVDSFNSLFKWQSWEYIARTTQLVVFSRDDIPVNKEVLKAPEMMKPPIIISTATNTDEDFPVASSTIRQLLRTENVDLSSLRKYFPNKNVLDYVRKHGLYSTLGERMFFWF